MPKTLKSLSPNESRRLQRACYRIEIFHTLNQAQQERYDEHQGGCPESEDEFSYFSDHNWAHTFQTLHQPWELEEISCVRDHLTTRYANISNLLAKDLKTWYRDGVGVADNISINDERARTKVVEYWISLGFGAFRSLDTYSRRRKEDRWEPRSWMTPGFPLKVALFDILRQGRKGSREHLHHGPRFPRDIPLRFNGDDNIDGPNHLWVEANSEEWQGYFFETDRGEMRDWGVRLLVPGQA